MPQIKETVEGNEVVPFSFIPMQAASHLEEIEKLVATLLEGETEYFLVSLRIKPTNNVKVFIDGDNGLPIEKCVQLNRKLSKLLDEAAFYPEGEFSLDLSSPGVDEPLKSSRQYKKNIGRVLKIKLPSQTIEAMLLEVSDENITVEWSSREPKKIGKGKETVLHHENIAYGDIIEAVVTITF